MIPTCDTVEACRAVEDQVHSELEQIRARIIELEGPAHIMNGVVKWSNGRLYEMTGFEAGRYCGVRYARLPTAREYALYAQSMGARGIRESAYPEKSVWDAEVKNEIKRMKAEKYYAIYKNSRVEFYYDHTGFKPPAGEAGYTPLWSSSKDPTFPINFYLMYGGSGGIMPGDGDKPGGVVCVQNAKLPKLPR